MLLDDFTVALDPVFFAKHFLGFNCDVWQARVLRAMERNIILNCGRQVGKSLVAEIKGLHQALFYPESLVLIFSPSLRQSSELFRKITDLMKLLPFKPKLLEENKLSLQFENGSRIISLPGLEGNIRGFSRVSLVIEDEASRVDDETYMALRPMVAVSQGSLLLLSTPCGKRGHFYREWVDGEGWLKISIPANQCPRITPAFLEQEKKTMGRFFAQEYLCEFLETEDQVFKYDDIEEALDNGIEPISLF